VGLSRSHSVPEKLFLLIATVFLAHSVYAVAIKTHGFARQHQVFLPEQCELLLRLEDVLEVLDRVSADTTRTIGLPIPKFLRNWSGRAKLMDSATDGFYQAVCAEPDDASVLAKFIIAREKEHQGARASFERLTKIQSDEAKRYALGLSLIYGYPLKQQTLPTMAKIDSQFMWDHLPAGWFRQHAMLQWQMRTGQFKQAKVTEKGIDQSAFAFLNKVSLLIVLAILANIIGILIIFIQLLFLARQVTPAQELPLLAAPASYGWLTIYKVFVSWLLTQSLFGCIATPILNDQASSLLSTALIIALICTTANALGLFYVYWFALRPNQVKFFDGVKLRLRVGKLGPVGMIFSGIATALACIPLVMVASFVAATYLGSHGSDNPIMSKIRDAAHQQDPLAIALFYLILGVIGPLCEEVLFRGFLFTSLRRVTSAPLAMTISAFLFSIMHLDPGGMLPIFCLGLVFAFAVEKTKSIVPSIIAHGLWNSASFTAVLLLFGN
jgi:membrane protease YdiL (CAAX protease family)